MKSRHYIICYTILIKSRREVWKQWKKMFVTPVFVCLHLFEIIRTKKIVS